MPKQKGVRFVSYFIGMKGFGSCILWKPACMHRVHLVLWTGKGLFLWAIYKFPFIHPSWKMGLSCAWCCVDHFTQTPCGLLGNWSKKRWFTTFYFYFYFYFLTLCTFVMLWNSSDPKGTFSFCAFIVNNKVLLYLYLKPARCCSR